MSMEHPGYPFGSVTPFVLLPTGHLAIYVSDIAQHTANMRGDPRVCLTVAQSGDGSSQELGRASVLADASPVPDDRVAAVAESYYGFFPAARRYGQAHDFALWWLQPLRVRYIAGFGRIHWVEAADWVPPAPEWRGDEASILEHMNADHADAVASIANNLGGLAADATEMVALDAEGCHIRGDDRLCYVPFANRARTSAQIRGAMVALTRTSRGEA